MACPFFLPVRKLEAAIWAHPTRLPLGAGWAGYCGAPGHEGLEPSDEELREGCNLGYASGCPRLPQQRLYDAVRFSVARERGAQVTLWFACEVDHRPFACGQMEYDASQARWISSHPDSRIQKMAECYLESYALRKIRPASAGAVPSPNHE